jgi:hypothetical protein
MKVVYIPERVTVFLPERELFTSSTVIHRKVWRVLTSMESAV